MHDDNNQDPEVVKDPQTEEEKVRYKLSEIRKSRTMRDDVERKYRWKDLVREYKGQFDMSDGRFDLTILPINLIFAYVKTELPSLYIRDPHIKVNPKNQTSIATAKVLEAVINYIWRDKKLKREIKKCIVDTLLVGHSWLKVGYTGKFGTIEDNFGNTVESVEEEDIFAYHVNWDNITFNTDAYDPPNDCEWISHAVWVSLDEVKKNPRYKNTELLQTGYEDKDVNYAGDIPDEEQKKKGKVRLEEFWDLKNKEVCTVSDGVDKYIEAPKPWPLKMKGFPFEMMKFNFSNDMAYGLSDVSMFEPQVLELIKVRSMALDHIKRYNRQLLTTPNNISDDEAQKIQKAITGSIITVEDPTKVLPMPYPPLQSDLYAIEERIKEDMINVSGQSPTERGASQKTSTRTMGELKQMKEGSVNRRSEKVDLVESFVEGVSSKLVGLLKQMVQLPYYVRILGNKSPELQAAIQERSSSEQEGGVTEEGGFTFTSEDIEGEYDLEPVSGSSTPMDRAEKLQNLFQMLELAPKTGALPGGPFVAIAAKMIIEEMSMPELERALQQEQEAQRKQKEVQAAREEELQTLAISTQAADTQMDAENTATKQNKVMIEFMNAMTLRMKAETEAKHHKEGKD